MAGTPSAATGFRLAAGFHRLVATVWMLSMAAFVPAQVMVLAAAGRSRFNLPAGGLGDGEDLLISFEIMRPVAAPLLVALAFGCLLFIAWWILWTAGTVRWWLNPETDTVRVTQILSHGLAVWWRFSRLALLTLILQLIVAAVPWLPLLADVEERFLLPLLIFGSTLTLSATILVWLATVRGAWILGEPGRWSAFAAWVRGLGAAVRQPLRSVLPLLVWALPGLALLVLPLLYDGPAATVFLFAAWLASAFCWVALHLSYAPPKPTPKPLVSPLHPPIAPYVTTRFPTLLRDE